MRPHAAADAGGADGPIVPCGAPPSRASAGFRPAAEMAVPRYARVSASLQPRCQEPGSAASHVRRWVFRRQWTVAVIRSVVLRGPERMRFLRICLKPTELKSCRFCQLSRTAAPVANCFAGQCRRQTELHRFCPGGWSRTRPVLTNLCPSVPYINRSPSSPGVTYGYNRCNQRG